MTFSDPYQTDRSSAALFATNIISFILTVFKLGKLH